MRMTAEGLRRETQSLSTALRKPQVRGRWGELHLRKAVELAGLVDRCDFAEQVRFDDGARRPDLVVRLVGGRSVVVDAKVPLDAYLDATSTDDEDDHRRHLVRHAAQLRTHVDALGAKRYWRSLEESPEFVVLFVPAESFLAAALETDPTPDRVRRGAAGRARDPDHPDRAAPHGRARLGPRGAGRPGARDPPPRPRAPRATGQHERPPRPARPLPQRRRRPLQPDRRLPGDPGAGLRAALRRPARTSPGRGSDPLRRRRQHGTGGCTRSTGAAPTTTAPRTIAWPCEPEDPLGRGARVRPSGRRARGRARPHVHRPGPAGLRSAHRALRHRLRADVRGRRPAGAPVGLLHRRRAPAAADGRRLRADRRRPSRT